MASARAERQLILLSAGTSARREAMRKQATQLMPDVDWSQLARRLAARRLLTVLGPRILEMAEDPATVSIGGIAASSAEGSTREEFAAAVEQALQAARRQGTFLQLVTLRMLAMLADANIRCAPLKGPLLGEVIYGRTAQRLSSDIDLLVAPEQLSRAVEVVRGLGYGPPSDHVLEDGLPLLHFVLVDERGKLPPVELHWRVHWYERRFACDRLLPPEVDPEGGWRPAPVDELAALLLFYARDGFIDLRMACDLSAWWDAHGAQLSPGALAELTRSYPELERPILSAVAAAERVVGLPAEEILGDARPLSLRERTAVRLVNPNPHASSSQLYADMGLVDGLLTPPGGFGAFVRRQLLPPAEVRDQQARHGSRARSRSRLGRCAGVLGRYGWRLAHLPRGPETLGLEG